jgi:hypothetical protein
MSDLTVQRWEREFRNEAKADKLAVLRNHLRSFKLRAKPELLLEGTIQAVKACSAYMKIDCQSYAPFLAMQTYTPARSPGADYAFTFSLFGLAFARVLVRRELSGLDLADLVGHPWPEYETAGFDHFWVMRADRTALKRRELVKLKRLVTDDLRYDYEPEELDFWFDESHTPGALFVSVQDLQHEPEEQPKPKNNGTKS